MKPQRIVDAQWAIVTGASSGIGLEFSRCLASWGCNILMVSNQEQELIDYAAEIASEHKVETAVLAIDLCLSDAPERIIEMAKQVQPFPILLVNNAGIFDFKAVSDLSQKRIDLYIDLHMRALTHSCRSIGAIMAFKGKGYILNMSSMSCWMPMPGIAMYAATKAYIRAFSRAYRIEMLEKGVSVTVACPGGIATDLFGLPRRLQKLGVAVGALSTPQKFARKALNRTLRRKAQYINGWLNRISIVVVASTPQWVRKLIKTKLLDRLSND